MICILTRLLFVSYDYTKGKLDELISIIIDSGAKLFVSAVGVPPKHVVVCNFLDVSLYSNRAKHLLTLL